jgi:hypothetical protein
MADVHEFSRRVIDLAERLEDVVDAANGKAGANRTSATRLLVLPAAGAGLYALATSGAFTRQAKGVLGQAKTRVSELPDDLFHRVRQTSQASSSGGSGQQRRRPAKAARKSSSSR